jgi:hypothetical protein
VFYETFGVFYRTFVEFYGTFGAFYGKPGVFYGKPVEFSRTPGAFYGKPGDLSAPGGRPETYNKEITMAGSYIPRRNADFDLWFKNICQYVTAKTSGSPPEWTHIPPAETAKLNAAYTDWYAAYSATFGPHSQVENLAKDEARVHAEAVIRPFVKLYLKEEQPAVTDMDRAAMNIHNRDTNPTRHPVPGVKPVAEGEPAGRGKHIITAINPETGSKKKPDLVSGVAFAHRKRGTGEPKAHAGDMPSRYQASPVKEFQWEESDYGMAVDYAAAYENEHGGRGAWSDVITLIIT